MHRSRLCHFVIDVSGLDPGVSFWSAALGAVEEPLPDISSHLYRQLRLPDSEIRILLQNTSDEKASKERMHLDLETDNVETEVQRLEALGATRWDHQQERGFDFWVLRDPWDNEFCVLQPNFPELLERQEPWNSETITEQSAASHITSCQPEDQVETLQLINSEVTASLAQQLDFRKSVDTKAIALVGYAGAASAFLATRHVQPILATLAYITYGMAAGLGILAYSLRSYSRVPNPRRLFNQYWRRPKTDALTALIAERVKVYEQNDHQYFRKARLWWMSLLSLALGMTLMISALSVAYW